MFLQNILSKTITVSTIRRRTVNKFKITKMIKTNRLQLKYAPSIKLNIRLVIYITNLFLVIFKHFNKATTTYLDIKKSVGKYISNRKPAAKKKN